MTEITLNGEKRTVEPGTTLADLIGSMGQEPQALATAINGEFVPRDARAQQTLRAGDAVMTFRPITGG